MQKTLGNQPQMGENESSRSGAINTVPALTTPAAKDSENMADSDSTTGRSPAFQFYPADFLSDPNVIVMSLQERGAYITLISLCWQSPLPNNQERLARLCGVPTATFRKLWPALHVCFRSHPDDAALLIHPRLERERAKQSEFRAKQAENGKKGGRPKNPPGNPNESQEKGLGFSGLTQTEPKKSSSSLSAISSFQSSDFRQRGSRRDQGLMAGSSPLAHGDCLVHGPVCFKPRFAAKFLPRFGGDHPAMVAWATTVCDDWTERVERGERVPEGDDFKFWDARYTEHHATQTPSESRLTTNLRRASEEFLKS